MQNRFGPKERGSHGGRAIRCPPPVAVRITARSAEWALCGIPHNAHHLRELERVGVVWDQGWANDMIDLLVEAKEAVEQAQADGREQLERSTLHSIRVRYGKLVARGWAANPAPEVGERHGINKKAANLLVRLDGQRADVLRFATDFRASWDNNQAERDVRMVKLQQKISGPWRTLAGARAYCTIRSYISTMRKHDVDLLDGLRHMFEGHAWLPGGTASSSHRCTVAAAYSAVGLW
ncbi:MAG: transposase [Actinomycetota bacterium]|nr:transposase [Actinomycetota bacterium]